MSDLKAIEDKVLRQETAALTNEIGVLIKRREDYIEEQYSRGLVKGGSGLQPLADRVANILGLPAPKVAIEERKRDESGFWSSAQNIAYLVEAFIKQGVPE
jgi:hypothetical protein